METTNQDVIPERPLGDAGLQTLLTPRGPTRMDAVSHSKCFGKASIWSSPSTPPTEGGAPDQADAGLVGLFIHKNQTENIEYEVFLIENVARKVFFITVL